MLWEISLLIIALAVVALVFFLIPTLRQIRQTAKSVEETTRTLNHNLPAILNNLDDISSNLASTTNHVHRQVEGVSEILDSVRGVVNDVVEIEKSFRRDIELPFREISTTLTGILRGIRAFLDTLKQG